MIATASARAELRAHDGLVDNMDCKACHTSAGWKLVGRRHRQRLRSRSHRLSAARRARPDGVRRVPRDDEAAGAELRRLPSTVRHARITIRTGRQRPVRRVPHRGRVDRYEHARTTPPHAHAAHRPPRDGRLRRLPQAAERAHVERYPDRVLRVPPGGLPPHRCPPDPRRLDGAGAVPARLRSVPPDRWMVAGGDEPEHLAGHDGALRSRRLRSDDGQPPHDRMRGLSRRLCAARGSFAATVATTARRCAAQHRGATTARSATRACAATREERRDEIGIAHRRRDRRRRHARTRSASRSRSSRSPAASRTSSPATAAGIAVGTEVDIRRERARGHGRE